MLQLIRRAASAARCAVSGRHGPGVGAVVIAVFAAIAAAVAVGAAAPTEARADTIINFPGGGSAVMHDDGSITGTCWIEPQGKASLERLPKVFQKNFFGSRPRVELTGSHRGGNIAQNRVVPTKNGVPTTNEAREETTMNKSK